MTTERELHDLLTAEVDAPARPAPWEDVVRRGRHHRRVARVRAGLGAGGVVVLAGLGVFAATEIGDDQRTGVVADDPAVDSGPTTTRDLRVPDNLGFVPDLEVARSSGSRVTLILGPSNPETGFDPCRDVQTSVTETDTDVTISYGLSYENQWYVECQSSPFSGSGTVELDAPLGSRRLIDGQDGVEIEVVDEDGLLFPVALPAPFDLARWDEFSNGEGWTFSWSSGDVVLSLSTSPVDADRPTACFGTTVEVRGVRGNLCREELSHELQWTDGSSFRALSLTDVGGNPLPTGIIDLVEIADGLRPVGASTAGAGS